LNKNHCFNDSESVYSSNVGNVLILDNNEFDENIILSLKKSDLKSNRTISSSENSKANNNNLLDNRKN
jgi:hypothetical protein